MISIFKKHKSVVLFLLKFFAVYFILSAFYSKYLGETQVIFPSTCSPITENVAKQTVDLLNFLGYPSAFYQHPQEFSIYLVFKGVYIAKVVEGCTSISVIILFIAFIVAFSGKLIPTTLYILFGSIFIYIINLIRIVLLCILLYKYPQYKSILHDLLFPAAIYGTVFLLWFFWVNNFSKLKK